MFLMLYAGDGETFDVDQLHNLLLASGAAKPRDAPRHCVYAYDYRWRGDTATLEVSDDQRTITIHRISDAAFAAAIEIQLHAMRPIRFFDEAYTFDLNLADFMNLQELRDAVSRAYGQRLG